MADPSAEVLQTVRNETILTVDCSEPPFFVRGKLSVNVLSRLRFSEIADELAQNRAKRRTLC